MFFKLIFNSKQVKTFYITPQKQSQILNHCFKLFILLRKNRVFPSHIQDFIGNIQSIIKYSTPKSVSVLAQLRLINSPTVFKYSQKNYSFITKRKLNY